MIYQLFNIKLHFKLFEEVIESKIINILGFEQFSLQIWFNQQL